MSVGFGQIVLILLVVFVIFGAGKLPSVMSDLAKGIRAFKKGLHDEEQTELNPQPATPTTMVHNNKETHKENSVSTGDKS